MLEHFLLLGFWNAVKTKHHMFPLTSPFVFRTRASSHRLVLKWTGPSIVSKAYFRRFVTLYSGLLFEGIDLIPKYHANLEACNAFCELLGWALKMCPWAQQQIWTYSQNPWNCCPRVLDIIRHWSPAQFGMANHLDCWRCLQIFIYQVTFCWLPEEQRLCWFYFSLFSHY